ncbi:AfsR/SARP family transcriptional regulator [Lentzea sp. HUAS12]|uniref:AfsR/SARP family transcriptional regulator n=1 Tax=Lentzea sp. HUAS12 TaxID=2951806 RepID=UPI00209DB773|nr:AfsR/SARP family transcriptional regulator [Lentzea sp. HUAS12]USX53397.1 AfsR/SARP family transcriptional regulator [Lentzea sp. HUAS12]
MNPELRFEILGPPRLVAGGRPRAIRSRNLSVILTALLVRGGRVVSVEELIDEVWHQPPRRARDAIYVYISKLRDQIGDGFVDSQFPGYALHLRGRQLDVQQFGRYRADGHLSMAGGDHEGAARAWRNALALHRGGVVSGAHSGPILSSFDSWLRQSRVECVELAAWAQLSAGLHHEAIGFLTHQLPQNPLNEILHQQLMLAFLLARHRAQALRVFGNACRTFSDRLGLEPGGDLVEVHEIVLADDVGRAKRVISAAVASRISSHRSSLAS